MDVLPTDDRGFIPLMEFCTVGKDEWIGFNTHLTVIPGEAMDYRSWWLDKRCATGPTGVYLEMEWGLDMDWYDHEAGWRPYIPLKLLAPDGKAVSESGDDWFFDFEMSTPWESTAGHFIVPEASQLVIERDLTSLSGYIDKITSNHPFQFNAPQPLDWSHDLLHRPFTSIEELQVAGGTIRWTVADYLGFLTWWTALISGWDANLNMHTVRHVKTFDLHRFCKRGVLIDW